MAIADRNRSGVQGTQVFKGFSSRAELTNFKLYDFDLIKQDLINRLSVRKGGHNSLMIYQSLCPF